VSQQVTAYRSRIDRNTVVLIIDISAGNNNVRARANIEAVRVLTTGGIASRIIDSHTSNSQAVAAINAHGLERCVLDVQVGDGGVS
jgi:hypothetical protein